jgi:hypothetical protein
MECKMARRAKNQIAMNSHVQFPPEADGEFDVVSTADIADWREKLSSRFGIGRGKLKSIEEPMPQAQA